ncbi:hypothetical protein AC578_10688 [Pseudocercospora eumusae]|uniref:Fibronectin type-III domain-containing protein n=1 Tax=Pseudocercospora eumusae TaxID=321146 RepID=A0A139HJH7_9PEZI|nr:hypothetical protein AC578_10688 [Pseudocercospora eumusae]
MISYPTAIDKTSTTRFTLQSSSSTPNMSSSDIEKAAGAQAFVQQPTAAHTSTRASFLPSYERAVNDNMRGFGEPAGQANLHAFDHVQEPKHAKRQCMKREWLIAAIVAIICLTFVLPLVVLILLRKNSTSEKTTILQTRSVTDTTFSVAPLTITTIAPSTVYVTVTPTPTSTSTPITTLTTTLSQPESTTSPTTETITSVSVSVSVSVSTASTTESSSATSSTSTSTTSSSTTSTTSTSSGMSPEESAAWSSVYAQSSANRAALTMVPDFRTSATTLLSITTVENTIEKTSPGPVATLTGHFGFCGVDGAAC